MVTDRSPLFAWCKLHTEFTSAVTFSWNLLRICIQAKTQDENQTLGLDGQWHDMKKNVVCVL